MAKTNPTINNALLKPHITEKAVLGADKQNVYVFDVTKDASKRTVGASVTAVYGVTPIKVHLVAMPTKRVYLRGRAAQSRRTGKRGGGKKAYVYLKKGDKIELV